MANKDANNNSFEENKERTEFIGKCVSAHVLSTRRRQYIFTFEVVRVIKGTNINSPKINLHNIYEGYNDDQIFNILKLEKSEGKALKSRVLEINGQIYDPFIGGVMEINEEIRNKEVVIKVEHIKNNNYRFIEIKEK